MATTVPPRSAQQRYDALERANSIRIPRARLKGRVKRGEVKVVTLIADPPEVLLSMKVWDLLLAQPHWGPVKVNKIFWRLQISPAKTVGGLSSRQCERLIDELSGR